MHVGRCGTQWNDRRTKSSQSIESVKGTIESTWPLVERVVRVFSVVRIRQFAASLWLSACRRWTMQWQHSTSSLLINIVGLPDSDWDWFRLQWALETGWSSWRELRVAGRLLSTKSVQLWWFREWPWEPLVHAKGSIATVVTLHRWWSTYPEIRLTCPDISNSSHAPSMAREKRRSRFQCVHPSHYSLTLKVMVSKQIFFIRGKMQYFIACKSIRWAKEGMIDRQSS